MVAQRGLDDISETIGNLEVPETQQGSANSTSQNAHEEQEASSSTRSNIVNLPAYSAWLKRADQFQLDPIFHKDDLSLVHFNSVDPKASYIKLKETDITPVARGWGKCLLGRFAGRFPGREVTYGLMKRWPCKARVTFHRRGWMIFQFGSEDDMEITRQKGPFDAFGTQLVLQSMPAKFDPDMEPEVRIPVWLRLVDLPLELWNLTAVSKIGSYLGTPLSTDFKTLRRESLDGPRIQVVINTAQRPREAVTVELPSGDFIDVKLEYEFLPIYCPACKNFGHLQENCPGSKDDWQLVRKKGVNQTPKARSRSKSATRQPTAQPTAPPPQQRAPPNFAQQPGPSKGQGSRQRNQWRQKGVNIPGVGPGVDDQQVHKGKSVLGAFPETPNKFDALGDYNETDHLTIPPQPSMAEFFTTVFELAEKQARANRGRSASRDPRLRAKQGPERTDMPSSNQVTAPTEAPVVQVNVPINKAPPEDNPTINEDTMMQLNTEQIPTNKDETEPAGAIVEPGEPSVRKGRSSSKRGEVKRKKSRSKSRTKEELGGQGPETDPGPCQ